MLTSIHCSLGHFQLVVSHSRYWLLWQRQGHEFYSALIFCLLQCLSGGTFTDCIQSRCKMMVGFSQLRVGHRARDVIVGVIITVTAVE